MKQSATVICLARQGVCSRTCLRSTRATHRGSRCLLTVFLTLVSWSFLGRAAVIQSFDLDSDPGWTVTGGSQWEYGAPQGQDGDPSAGKTGSNVYGVNRSGSYTVEVGASRHLTTGPIDCSGHTAVQLSFWRWLRTDQGAYVGATVDVSSDNTNWTNVYTNPSGVGQEVLDTVWSQKSYDISAIADGQSAVYVRWGYEIKHAEATQYGGWNIDDVEVVGTAAGNPAPTVTEITPASALDSGSVSITDLAGTGFQADVTVKLTKSGQTDIEATGVTRVSGNQITCSIDLNGAALGLWNVVVTNPDEQSGTLTDGFEVLSSLATIGGRTWNDTDQDGDRGAGETGLAGLTVTLWDGSMATEQGTTTTDASGFYSFSGLTAGTFVVQVEAPADKTFGPMDQGADDTADSDVDPLSGLWEEPRTAETSPFTVAAGETKDDIDASLVPAVIHVDESRTGGNQNGSSWTDALTTLPPALDLVVATQEVWLGPGTYTPGAAVESTFRIPDFAAVRGGFAGHEAGPWERSSGPGAPETVLSGDLGGGVYSQHVVTLLGTSGSQLDRLTISGGRAVGAGPDANGGGVYAEGVPQGTSLTGCRIAGNTATGDGGGVYALNGDGPQLSDSTVDGNQADRGGGVYVEGGFGTPESPMISGNTISGNTAGTSGGGVYAAGANALIEHNRITGNSAEYGGGVFVTGGAVIVRGNLVRDNTATVGGGGLNLDGASPPVTNNTIYGNHGGTEGGGGIRNHNGSSPTVTNTILYGNTGASGAEVLNTTTGTNVPTFDYCCVENGLNGSKFTQPAVSLGANNISDAPQFADLSGTDLRLGPTSPCIDRGLGAVGLSHEWDLDQRGIWDHPFAANNGGGSPTFVDIGAYETRILFVDHAATGGQQTGRTWADASLHPSDALFIARPGDQVWIADGTYTPDTSWLTDPREATFRMQDDVSVIASFAGTEGSPEERGDIEEHPTIFSGEIGAAGYADNVRHVVSAAGNHNDGLFITAGNADGAGDQGRGGGILGNNQSSAWTDCTVYGNRAVNGAGYHTTGGSAQFSQSRFYDNTATGNGGAIGLAGGTCTLREAVIHANSAGNGGGVYADGVGTVLTVTQSTLHGNSATGAGGGLYVGAGTTATANGGILWGNTPDAITGPAAVVYSDVQQAGGGTYTGIGNINADPHFHDPTSATLANRDYRLQSQAGRWDPSTAGWDTSDSQTSPCIDTGDPGQSAAAEALPNGGRINMGAYGGTSHASKSWVDHFGWSTITSPQTQSQGFAATITAQDVAHNTVATFAGSVGLSATPAGTTVSPATTSAFVSGVWTGTVTVGTAGAGVALAADDGAGHVGASNEFSVTALPKSTPPTGVDLAAGSDTGLSDTDNTTQLDNSTAGKKLQFDVAGSTMNADVRLYSDGTLIGTGTGNGGTLTLATNGTVDLADGTRTITATQQLAGESESDPTPGLSLTIDTTRATVVSRAPTPGAILGDVALSLEVTFSEPLPATPLDSSDLVLTGYAATGANVGDPVLKVGTTTTWQFPVNGLVDGDLDVNLAPDPDDVEDAAGNDLDPSPTSWSYTVDVAPTVVTTPVTDIGRTTATGGGNVTDDRGSPVTARGVCWSTTASPTVDASDGKTTDGTGEGMFSSQLPGLVDGTTYHARAYATTALGTGYGATETFTTIMTPPGNALEFDGDDDYVTLGNAAQLKPTTALTVEVWGYRGSWDLGAGQTEALIGCAQAGGYELILNSGDSGRIEGYVEIDDGYRVVGHPAASLTSGWHHFALTCDGRYTKLYVDGILRATDDRTATGALTYAAGNSVLIGAEAHTGDTPEAGYGFSGRLDGARIWSVARSGSDIRAGMHRYLTGEETGLVGCYRFDQKSGTQLIDSGPHGRHGELRNMDHADWVTSSAPLGHESHVGLGTSHLAENADVPVDLTWGSNAGDDPGPNAVFATIQVNAPPVVTDGLLTHVAPVHWQLWIADDDAFVGSAAIHYDDVGGIGDETELALYGQDTPDGTWTLITDVTLDDEGSATDGIGSITANDLSAFQRYMLSSSGATNTFVPTADLQITKDDTPDPVIAGMRLTYSITVQNNGPHTAEDVVLSDPLPAELNTPDYSLDAGQTWQPWQGVLNLGALVTGAAVDVQIEANVQPDTDGPITNTASVVSVTPDPVPANDSATTTATAQPRTAAPSAVDLVDGSDTGASQTDDLTRLDNHAPASILEFDVSGTVVGAAVRLYADGSTLIGEATATSTTTRIASNGSVDLADGMHPVTAKQEEAGKGVSDASPARNVTIDTQAPLLSSSNPADNAADVALNADPELVFSETVHKGTGNIEIRRSAGNGVVEGVDVTSAGVTLDTSSVTNDRATIGLASALPGNRGLYVLVGAGCFSDPAGNPFAGVADNATLNFHTVNAAPVTVNDTYSTNGDENLIVPAVSGVLGNDSDVDSDPLTAVSKSDPSHGTVALNSDGSFTYSPAAGYHGADSFTYAASDGTLESGIATVNITVTGVFVLQLQAGWNLGSSPLEPLTPEIDVLLDDGGGGRSGPGPERRGNGERGTVHSVFEWRDDQYHGAAELHAGHGYWIYAAAAADAEIVGVNPPENPSLNVYVDDGTGACSTRLSRGWNLVGPVARVANPYVAGVQGAIWYWDGRRYRAVAEAESLEPGRAYWVNASVDDLVYPLGTP